MIKIKRKIGEVVAKISKKKKQPSLLKQIKNNPENFILEASIEGEEVIIKIKRKS